MKALVVDDEPLARRRLRDLLALVPWLTLCGEASDGDEAREMIETQRPEVVFLDVEMPGLKGTELLRRVKHRPAVVFTTAFDRHAVTAFELNAVDYLLKPFGRERFLTAVERVRERLAAGASPAAAAAASEALGGSAGRLDRIFLRDRGRIVPLPAARIERLESQDDYVALHVGRRAHLVHVPLAELVERLDPDRFVRVHRSHVVNLDWVAVLHPLDATRYEVEMKDGARVPVSRARARELRRRTL